MKETSRFISLNSGIHNASLNVKTAEKEKPWHLVPSWKNKASEPLLHMVAYAEMTIKMD